MKLGIWGLVALSFITGLFTAHLLEIPQLPSASIAAERASPQDWVSQDDISVFNDKVEINIPNAKWATFADTNSMDPLLDAGTNGIQIVPASPDDIEIGDVITYDYNGRKIIHRVVDIEIDAYGHLYTVKGDNNAQPDPVDVRFEDIERVLVAVIY